VKKVDKENMKKALAANQEYHNINDASFGNAPDGAGHIGMGPGLKHNNNNFEYENSNNNEHHSNNVGTFQGAKISQGPISLPSGAVYEGEWRNELREGFGR
jgi:hypothetical protein